MRGGPVDPQQHKSGLPDHAACLRIRALLPHVGIPVLGRCNNAVRLRSPVDGGDDLVVLYVNEAIGEAPVRGYNTTETNLRERLGRFPIVSLAGIYLHVVRIQAHRHLWSMLQILQCMQLVHTHRSGPH